MKYIKYLFYFLLVLIIIGFALVKFYSIDEPSGVKGEQADQLAHKMLKSLNEDAFDSIKYLSWEFFRPGQKYLWDKETNKAVIEWDNNKVVMALDTQEGDAYTDGAEQKGENKQKLMAKAWSNWCNDSFWMIAPYKVFDSGTIREVIKNENGTESLLVRYVNGGVTPGDSYLWELDKNHLPTGWRMWTKIIPVKGIYTSWKGWENHLGAMLSTKHSMASLEMNMSNVKTGNSLEELGLDTNPFEIK